ncbi:hypothetical protein JCM8115_005132 [Rhodotorula mucilaginosa]|uniref:RING-type domain-containing protein n=1 Tax=Rhodotorula mucilaginosa TaxID=5537 RepID=A0A9P7B964_RHOMI|nr:hypothetical protein C6P46_000194 [Rhodotorula mucilaginosa]TKA58409.1 hypothetical protein B0A53_00148 [Rhodotorula sp. CCFEE 5036]
MSSSTWSETGSKSGSPLSSPPPPPPLFRPSDSRSPTPGGADQQHGSQTMQASSTKSPSTIIECILPKPGSYRRAVYDSVIADFPDVSPPYLLHRMNVHRDDAVKVIDELFGGGYPLAQGGFQVRVDPPAEGGAKDEDSSQPGLKHHVECQCCLEEVPLSQVGHCDAGHAFCSSCLSKRVSDAIASKKPELTCFAIGTVCAASFPPVELKRAVPRPLLDKLDDLQLQVDLDQADLADLEKCPFCPFAAIVDEDTVRFACQACKAVSCRRCHHKEHGFEPCPVLPLTEGDVLHQIEEAMSEAIIRKCPSCGVACTKIEGCNKMTCGPCGTHFCYVCGERTERSAHWNESASGDIRCPANDDSEKRSFDEAQKARKRKIAELESYGITVPECAKSSKFGPSAPKRTKLEEEALYRNGRHVFRSQESSFEHSQDRDLLRGGHAPRGSTSRAFPPALPAGVPTSNAPPPPPWFTFRDFGMMPPLPQYGYAAAGSGIFGGGAPGGGASGSGSWTGGKRRAEVGGVASSAGDATESEPPTPPPEPEEVRRQKTLMAALKRRQDKPPSRKEA